MIVLNQLKYAEKNFSLEINLKIKKGELIALAGASGAGKSTLLNLIAGFIYPQSGEIFLNQQNHTYSRVNKRPISMLFQDNNLFVHLTVFENILLGLKPNLTASAMENSAIKKVAQQVNLESYLQRFPNTLSGGQQQRVAIARCLLRSQPILLLDEPFSALDPQLRTEMMTLIVELCRSRQLTLLMVTHQIDEVKNSVDRLIYLENGKLIT